MVIPVVLYPEIVQSLAITIAELVDKESGPAIAFLVSQPVRFALGTGFFLFATAYFAFTYGNTTHPRPTGN